VNIRPATPADGPAIWCILEPMIRAGETYALPRDMSGPDALGFWMGEGREAFVAEDEGAIVGTYYLRPNQMGGGSHVCNCGYVAAPQASGRGVATAMCNDSLGRARERGYRAMQFNFVVSTNTRAVALWHSLGFREIGRVPGGFLQPGDGFVDALILFREL
jgi:ribosomal protein S18 acetylase RimI-like enzyme